MDWQQKLRMFLYGSGLTVAGLARLLGLSRGTLYRWFERRRPPGKMRREQIAQVLGISPETIWSDLPADRGRP